MVHSDVIVLAYFPTASLRFQLYPVTRFAVSLSGEATKLIPAPHHHHPLGLIDSREPNLIR